MRLDKLLAMMQYGTRNEVKQLIRQGNVTVDGNRAVSAKQHVDPQTQIVCCFGKRLRYQKYVYYMLYKPKGCVTARKDNLHDTVMDYIKDSRKDLFPVGRLDLDTEGLLLITNDGDLSHRLLSPAKHVKKVYEARIDGLVTSEHIKAFAAGVDIGDDTLTAPAELTVLEAGEISNVRVAITEGRYHQIKRMFLAMGRSVVALKRIAMGNVKLDDLLAPGEYRELTEQELNELKGQEDTYAKPDKSRDI